MAKTKPVCVNCGNKKEVSFDGVDVQYPVFSCPKCGPDVRNEWAIWWEEYKDVWKDPEAWAQNKNKITCIVGFFCNYYLEFYGQPFVFSYANPIPYKDKEYVQARRLLTMFNGDAKEVKTFIKWVFVKRVKEPTYPVTSLGFLTTQKFVNEYLQAKARSAILKRTSTLPETFIDWCKAECPEIFQQAQLQTWNDLNFIITYVQCYGADNLQGRVVLKAQEMGLISSVEVVNLEDR